jgi:L-alanine-DL-glutamate epimerase-like enolase superfamily enzyme
MELMIDIGKGWRGAGDAPERVRAVEQYRLAWIEEPFMPDEYARYRALAGAVEVPLAAGEEETTAWDFERLIERGGVAILQPDVTRVGGISECVRVGELAHRHGLRFVPHAWSTGIIKAATLQVLASSHEAEWFEYCVQDTPLNQLLVQERFPLVDGYVEIPCRPGLGVELDEDALDECLVRTGS